MTTTHNLCQQFGYEDSIRTQMMCRLRKLAAYTIPNALPPENTTINDTLPESYQSLGSTGVDTLTSTVLTTMFPTIPWFGMGLSDKAAATLKQMNPQAPSMFELALSLTEQRINKHMDTTNYRLKFGSALEQLAVLGNGLVRLNSDYSVTSWKLSSYVTRRAPSGDLLQVIIKEKIDPLTLTQAQRTVVGLDPDDYYTDAVNNMFVFTRVRYEMETRKWTLVQEINGKIVAESEYTVCPYIAPRWKPEDGEHYGRGFVEDKHGDLRSFDGLSKAILQASAAAAKMLLLVDPTGVTKLKQVAEAENLAVLYGRAQDATFLQTNKSADLSVALKALDAIEKRLGQSMLLFLASRRTGDRVTAAEIKATVSELDSVLGGVYTNLVHELQRPFLERYLYQMQVDGLLPFVPKGFVNIKILTGVEALTRENELQKVLQTLQIVGQLPGVQERLNGEGIARFVFTQRGVDPTGLIKTEEQIQQERAALMQQQAALMAAQKTIETVGNVAGSMATQQTQQPQQAQ